MPFSLSAALADLAQDQFAIGGILDGLAENGVRREFQRVQQLLSVPFALLLDSNLDELLPFCHAIATLSADTRDDLVDLVCDNIREFVASVDDGFEDPACVVKMLEIYTFIWVLCM